MYLFSVCFRRFILRFQREEWKRLVIGNVGLKEQTYDYPYYSRNHCCDMLLAVRTTETSPRIVAGRNSNSRVGPRRLVQPTRRTSGKLCACPSISCSISTLRASENPGATGLSRSDVGLSRGEDSFTLRSFW